jgi:general secretion pathway protein C
MSINSQQVISSINLGQLEARLKPVFQFLARIPLSLWQRIVRVLLVIWLASVLAQMIWILIPKPTIPPAKVESIMAGPQASLSQSNSIDIDKLKTATPFGDAAAAPVAVDAPPEVNVDTQELADTQLNLILRGLVYSNDEKVARAVIAANDRQEVFAVGDPIPVGNNVTLAKILADRVIINNNGRNESLWLFKDDPNAPKMTSFSAPPNPSIDPPGARPPIAYTPPQNMAPAGNDAASQVNGLSDVVAMSIHRENGQIVGYKIRPGRNAAMFESLGLQSEDIVTAVNGMPLNNPGKIMEIYRSLGSATSANLQILRKGSTVNLDISLNH